MNLKEIFIKYLEKFSYNRAKMKIESLSLNDSFNISFLTVEKNRKKAGYFLIFNVGNKFEFFDECNKYKNDNNISFPIYAVFFTQKLEFFIYLIPQKKIDSVSSYLELIKNIDKKENQEIFFRGQPSEGYGLVPSIYRSISEGNDTKFVKYESAIFREAIRQSPEEFPKTMSTFDMLVKMQHYGLPTRLLDITKNALVSLFMTVSYHATDKNGDMILFFIPKNEVKFYDSDTVCLLSNISKVRESNYNFTPSKDKSKNFNKTKTAQALLWEIRSERPVFYPVIQKEDLSSVICVLPKMDNKRIIAQEGAFLLFGATGKKDNCAEISYFSIRILIDKDIKSNLLEELKDYGIDEAHMYPEFEHKMKRIKENVTNL